MNTGFTYNSAGDMMSNPLQAGISNYAENRMRQAGTGGPVYRYGADGPWVMRAAYNAASQWIVPTNTDVWFHLRDPFGRLRSIKRYKDKGSAGVDWVTDKQYDYFLDRMQDRATKTWYGRDRLGSVRAVVKPSGSTWAVTQRISYFPYGQEQGVESANDTFKFGTYWREGVLDDAQQRWYGSKWGRFASADPSEGSGGAGAPGSWNRYSYVQGDPINFGDPDGLTACGDLPVDTGGTVRDQVNASTGQGHFIDLVWHEGGFLNAAGGDVGAWTAEFELTAQAIWDRTLLVQGKLQVTGANGVVYGGGTVGWLGYGAYGSTLNQVLINAAALTGVLNSSGQLVDNANALKADLNQDQGDLAYSPGRVPLYYPNGGQVWVTEGCYSVIAAMESANSVAAGMNFNPQGMFITSWNVRDPQNNPNYAAGVEAYFGKVGPTNLFGFRNFTYGNFVPTKPRGVPPGRQRARRRP
jgi:RHS repeat-associated protein